MKTAKTYESAMVDIIALGANDIIRTSDLPGIVLPDMELTGNGGTDGIGPAPLETQSR